MKITKSILKKIIRTELNEAREPMTPDYVLRSLTGEKNVRTGEPFIVDAMLGLETGDNRKTADAIMNALWIDDPPLGADEELANMVRDAYTEDDLAEIGAEWGTHFFRGGPVSEPGLQEVSQKQRGHETRLAGQMDERAAKEAEREELRQILWQAVGQEWEVNVRMLEGRYQLTVHKAYTGE